MIILRFAPRLGDSNAAASVFCRKNFRSPVAAELVHLPFVLFRYAAEFRSFGGGRKTLAGLFLADLVRGEPMNVPRGTRFEIEPGLESEFSDLIPDRRGGKDRGTPVIRIESGLIPDPQVIPPLLKEEEAILRSKTILKYDLMRLAGGLSYRDFSVVPLPGSKVVYYPLWVIYYRRRRGEIGFATIDALTGKREGTGLAAAVAQGLVRKKSLETKPESSEGVNLN